MKNSSRPCAALILAADRHPGDPVAQAAGTPCKALAPVAGVPMLQRVVRTLEASARIERITLVGPSRGLLANDAELVARLDAGVLDWVEPAASPSASAARALAAQPAAHAVLLTTADHALLEPAMVDTFLARALAGDCDFVVGVARLETVQARYPATRRTAIRLRGGPYCGCNLFAFVTPRGRELAVFWQRIEQARKRPWRVITGALGWGAVVRYLLGRLTLEQALDRLSRRLGVKIGAVVLPYAEAAIDVDTPADLQLVEGIFAARPAQP